MQKMVTVMAKQVKDVGGLYVELRKQAFDVLNVGSDQAGTYVYLAESEIKDPTPYVEEWAEKPAPFRTKGEVRKRKEELEKIKPLKPAPLTVMIPHNIEPPLAAVDASAPHEGGTASEEQPKPGFLKSLMRKLFS